MKTENRGARKIKKEERWHTKQLKINIYKPSKMILRKCEAEEKISLLLRLKKNRRVTAAKINLFRSMRKFSTKTNR